MYQVMSREEYRETGMPWPTHTHAPYFLVDENGQAVWGLSRKMSLDEALEEASEIIWQVEKARTQTS